MSDSASTGTESPIKYLLIGDSSTTKIITEFTSGNPAAKTKKEINQIFKKLCKSSNIKYDERNKITSKDENYYFTFTRPSFVFLILVQNTYPERLVFQLIDQINSEEIPSMVNDETKELNPNGRQALKALVDQYQDQRNFSKVADIQSDVDSIKDDMRKNIDKMVESVDDVNDLQNKSESLKLSTEDYKKSSVEVKRITWWQNFKLWIILAGGVLLLLLIIIFIVT